MGKGLKTDEMPSLAVRQAIGQIMFMGDVRGKYYTTATRITFIRLTFNS